MLVLLNFSATQADDCTVSAPSSALAQGAWQATDALGDLEARTVTVGPDGEIADAEFAATLRPRQGAVMVLSADG